MEAFIVIGAGLAGASTAWHLTQRGRQVTLLERTTPANAFGSSHGSARIFRYAYPDRLYTDLVVRARTGWSELERQSRRTLIETVGSFNFGVEPDLGLLTGGLAGAGVEHELLPAAEAGARWPGFAFDTPVLWQPGAGVLDPEATVAAMVELAHASGTAEVLTEWTADRLERTHSGYRVHSTTGETIEGTRVIVAAGGWLPELVDGFGLPDAMARAIPPLEVRQEQIFHFPYREQSAPAEWPTFIHGPADWGPDGFMTYGLPGGRDGEFRGHKLAQFNGGPVIGSARAQDRSVRAENRRLMIAYVKRYLPGLEPEPYAEATCLFTNTPTEDFIFEEQDGVVLVSACSGHGAKFAPLLGELAADLAMGTGTVPDRFRLGSAAGGRGER